MEKELIKPGTDNKTPVSTKKLASVVGKSTILDKSALIKVTDYHQRKNQETNGLRSKIKGCC